MGAPLRREGAGGQELVHSFFAHWAATDIAWPPRGEAEEIDLLSARHVASENAVFLTALGVVVEEGVDVFNLEPFLAAQGLPREEVGLA
eukprot:3247106-Alexandrium_andersonii.AAC.1